MTRSSFLKTLLGCVSAAVVSFKAKSKKPVAAWAQNFSHSNLRARKWKHDELYNRMQLRMMDRAQLDSLVWVMPLGWPHPKT